MVSNSERDRLLDEVGAVLPDAAVANLKLLVGEQDEILGWLVAPHMVVTDAGFQSAAEVLVVREQNLLYWGCWDSLEEDEDAAGGEGAEDAEPGEEAASGQEVQSRIVPWRHVQQARLMATLAADDAQDSSDLPAAASLVLILSTLDDFSALPIECADENCALMHGWQGTQLHDALKFGGNRETIGDEALTRLLQVAATLSANLGR